MSTQNAPAPQLQPITPENRPVFPCWLWCCEYTALSREPWGWQKWAHSPASTRLFTHWHPDQPTAPTDQPDEHSGNNIPNSLKDVGTSAIDDPRRVPVESGPATAHVVPHAPDAGTPTVEQQLDATTIDLQNALIDRATLQVDKNRLERDLNAARAEVECAKRLNECNQNALSSWQRKHAFAESEVERLQRHWKIECAGAAQLRDKLAALRAEVERLTRERDDRRESLARNLRDGLRTRGLFAPDNPADIPGACLQAIDASRPTAEMVEACRDRICGAFGLTDEAVNIVERILNKHFNPEKS